MLRRRHLASLWLPLMLLATGCTSAEEKQRIADVETRLTCDVVAMYDEGEDIGGVAIEASLTEVGDVKDAVRPAARELKEAGEDVVDEDEAIANGGERSADYGIKQERLRDAVESLRAACS